MPKVFTGKVAIPGDRIDDYLDAVQQAKEERDPFRNDLQVLNLAFADHIAEKFSERTADKHAFIIQMFIEFLVEYTDVRNLEEVTVGIANTHFQTWYRRKVLDRSNDNDRKVAVGKFFHFLAEQKGLVNAKVLASFGKVSGGATGTVVQRTAGQATLILRAKLAHNKRVYRDIELPVSQSLHLLAEAIVGAFNFDFDHAFGFYGTDNPRRYHDAAMRYELFADLKMTDERGVKGVKHTKVSSVFTQVGQQMVFLFDYGDEWLFLLEVRGFGAKVASISYPKVVLSRGEAPEQYPSDDEEG